MKRFALLLALAASLAAQITVSTIADITMTGSAQQLSSTSLSARWVQIVCPSGNSAVVRVGGSSVSSSRGIAVAAGGGFFFPPSNTSPQQYDLSRIYVIGTASDKVTVTYAH